MALNGFKAHKTINIHSLIPGCMRNGSEVIFTTDISYEKTFILKLFDISERLIGEVDLVPYRINSIITSVTITDGEKSVFSYEYVADGQIAEDKYMMKPSFIRKWGSVSSVRPAVYDDDFDWADEKRPNLKYEDTISYLLHVRGYSMEDSSVSKNKRGTFSGITEKSAYFSDLGINQLILMPAYDFNEIISHKKTHVTSYPVAEDAALKLPSINYWGYSEGNYFCPKSSFGVSNPVNEFKEMVKNLHNAGIEVIMQMYFPDTFSRKLIADILRHWVFEYHVDGFYVMGSDIPSDVLCDDYALRDVKFYFDTHNIDKVKKFELYKKCQVCYFDAEYMNNIRRFLKSDEAMLSSFLFHVRNNPSDVRVMNYITSNTGFTLYDLVSYDRKHNEDNYEDNRDGSDYNYSWNCGFEGPSRKKSVAGLRMRQIKNILTMLMLSQGTPMLLGGDENLNSQNGNNNAYCQDNKIGYVDWKETKDRLEIRNFLKELISLRRNHPILHLGTQMSLMDSLSCGYPDMSYHQEDAYRASFDPYCRYIAYMLCGNYAMLNNKQDDFFYVAYNMHWEKHDFALPKLPKGLKWSLALYTGEDNEKNVINNELENKNDYLKVPHRSVVVLKSSKVK